MDLGGRKSVFQKGWEGLSAVLGLVLGMVIGLVLIGMAWVVEVFELIKVQWSFAGLFSVCRWFQSVMRLVMRSVGGSAGPRPALGRSVGTGAAAAADGRGGLLARGAGWIVDALVRTRIWPQRAWSGTPEKTRALLYIGAEMSGGRI